MKNWREIAGVILPGALLALLPKCPVCFAAYFALAGGVSLSAAGYLKTAMVVVCLAIMALAAMRLIHKFHLKHKHN